MCAKLNCYAWCSSDSSLHPALWMGQGWQLFATQNAAYFIKKSRGFNMTGNCIVSICSPTLWVCPDVPEMNSPWFVLQECRLTCRFVCFFLFFCSPEKFNQQLLHNLAHSSICGHMVWSCMVHSCCPTLWFFFQARMWSTVLEGGSCNETWQWRDISFDTVLIYEEGEVQREAENAWQGRDCCCLQDRVMKINHTISTYQPSIPSQWT